MGSKMTPLNTGRQAPVTDWIEAITRGGGPRYLQILEAMERALSDGRLRPGDRLPPQRQLAAQLHVDLTTVSHAYREAIRREWVRSKGARGTYVAASKAELSSMVDLGMNIPPCPQGIDLADLLRQGASQVLVRNDANLLMTYHLAGGGQADREAARTWLLPMLGAVDLRCVATCPGAQSAIAALIMALTRPGDIILAEPLAYPGFLNAVRQLGRTPMPVATDEDGMRPDALEQACHVHGARVVYLNPTLQNPTTRTMPESRRREIAAVAEKWKLELIEDDPYWLLADAAPAPLARIASKRVHYVSTLSKCLSPGVRTAFVVSPDARAQSEFLAALRSIALMAAPLATALVTQWVLDGTAARILAGVRTEARARQRIARDVLVTEVNMNAGDCAGIHLWHVLPDRWTTNDLVHAARSEGLALTPSDVFQVAPTAYNAIRISLGGVSDRQSLGMALRRLSTLLSTRPAMHQSMVV